MSLRAPQTQQKHVAPLKIAPRAKPGAGRAKPGDQWRAWLEACKARLMVIADGEYYWAWWRYAVDNSWIIPSGESLADAQASKMFEGLDRARPIESMKTIVQKHQFAVLKIASSCSVEHRNELLRAAVPLPAAKSANADKPDVPAPNCDRNYRNRLSFNG